MSNINYDLSQLMWMDMTEGQRSIYMEFYAPILENNIKRMPENEELINSQHFTPVQIYIDAFSNWDGSIENLSREACYIYNSLTDGQINAIVLWLSEPEEEGGEYEEEVEGTNIGWGEGDEEIDDW